MNPIIVTAVLLALVALATAMGLLWRARTGRVRHTGSTLTVAVGELRADARPGRRATLLQFSTEVCAPCHAAHALLQRLAEETPDVAHVDVDVTRRPDLAQRFGLLQSPTTLILDSRGTVRARIGGAPRADELRAALQRILAA